MQQENNPCPRHHDDELIHDLMFVQPILCPCHEGSDVQGTSQTQVSPETPVWRHCLVYFTSHPPTSEPAPSQTDLPTVHPHTTRTPGALTPIRWLFNLCCARVMRAATSREPAKLRFPQKHQFGVTASLFHSVQYILLPTHPPPNPRPLKLIYLQCIRTPGPCAPAHQMVVQPMLCPCHEGSEVQRTSQTQVSPETPDWRHCLSLPQCAVYFTSHPPTSEPAPSQTDLPTVHPHTGAVRSRPSDGCSTYAVPVS